MANFIITVLLGWCGIHKFLQKKAGMGIIYLFTFGLFGIGWFYDCITAFRAISKKAAPAASIPQYSIADQLCGTLDPEFVSFVLPMIKSGISYSRIAQAYRNDHPDTMCDDLELRISYVGNYHSNITTLADLSSCNIQRYRIVACDDEKMCDVCRKFKGRSFAVSSAKIGYNCPPFHLGCRCIIVIDE